jgi:hypothetical protein
MEQFLLGKLLCTEDVAALQEKQAGFAAHVWRSLQRYTRCDWGEVDDEDSHMNDSAIGPDVDSISAVYTHPDHPDWEIWIITGADRSATTVMFPADFWKKHIEEERHGLT